MKAVFFDIGGVVIYTDFKKLYSDFAARAGIDPDFVIQYHKTNKDDLILGNISLQSFFETMREAAQNNYTVDELKSFWREEAAKNRVINKELLNWIDNNRKRFKIGAITNLTHSRLMVDQEMDIYPHFDLSVLSCVEHLEKPDPKFYELALTRLGITATESVFIDDRAEFVSAAKEAGFKEVLFVNNDLLFAELKQILD